MYTYSISSMRGSVNELDEQVLLSVVLGVVEHCQHHTLHESVGTILGHLKDQLGKEVRVRLQQVKQMLIGLHDNTQQQ